MKHLAIYGVCGGVLIVAMRFVEYRFLVVSHSIEIYAALVAAAFAAIGIWFGLTPSCSCISGFARIGSVGP